MSLMMIRLSCQLDYAYKWSKIVILMCYMHVGICSRWFADFVLRCEKD